jgi:hypothetical protein
MLHEGEKMSEEEKSLDLELDKAVKLVDPNTGEPIRDGKKGVPISPWVGKHKNSDVDDALNLKTTQDDIDLE